MADNQKIKDLNEEYKEVLKTVQALKKEQDELEKTGEELSAQKKEELKVGKELLKVIEDQVQEEREKLNIEKETTKVLRSHAKLSHEVKKQLGLQVGQASVFKSLSIEVAEIKAQQLSSEGESLERLQKQELIIDSTLSAMESQAKAVERALKGENGREEFEQRRRDLQAARLDLEEEQYKTLLDALNATEELYNKEQRILQIKESQKSLFNALPDSIKSAVNGAEGLGKSFAKVGFSLAVIGGLVGVLVTSLSLFTSLDESAESFRNETGIAVSQMAEMRSQSNRLVGDFRELGLEAKDYYDLQKEIVGVLGDTARISDSVAGTQAVITKNFGVSNQAAAKTLQVFQSLGGVSENTAANLQLQTLELAKQAGVAPAKVLQDIAESSDSIYGAFQGNSEELIKQAVQARRLGTNLKDVLETTEKLLDFESSITQELEASAFVGGQFNLTQARALRAAGDIAGAQEEILRQIQRSGDFRQQDVFTQRALASAAGMTVDEITRQLTVQDKLNSLSAEQRALAENAIKQGLDISNINDNQLAQEVQRFALQKQQQGQLTNIKNSFGAIATSLGSSFLPLLEKAASFVELIVRPFRYLGDILKTINESLVLSVGFYGSLLALSTRRLAVETFIVAQAKLRNVLAGIDLVKQEMAAGASFRRAVADVFSTSMRSFSFVPFGAIAGAALAASIVGALVSKIGRADDAIFGGMGGAGYGKRALLEEGSVTLFNNRDTIVAGTNLAGGNISQPSNGTDKLISTIERLEKAYMRGAQVNLDGQRVIRGLGLVGNETTQNNFSLV